MIRLRPLEEEDLPRLHGWYQDPSLWTHLVGAFRPRTQAEAIAYMRAWLSPSGRELRLGIEFRGRLVGQVSLTDIGGGEAEFNIFLGEEAERGLGLGRAATSAMLARAFGELGLRRVRLRVLETNGRARAVYRSLGFEPEGPIEETLKDGAPVGVIAMSLGAERFRAAQDRSAIT